MPVDLRSLTAFDAIEGMAVIIPLGSIEQHCRLPVGLDCMIAERLSWLAAGRAEEALGARAFAVAPPLCYGFSPEWRGVPGTVAVPAPTLLGLLEAIIGSLGEWGFERVVILNAHGGNTPIAMAAASEASHRLGAPLVAVIDYWRAAGIELGHACDIEEALARDLGIIEAPPGRGGCSRLEPGPRGLVGGTLETPAWTPSPSSYPGLEAILDSLAGILVSIARAPRRHYL